MGLESPWDGAFDNDRVPPSDDGSLLGENCHMNWGVNEYNVDFDLDWGGVHIPLARPPKKRKNENRDETVETTNLINEFFPLPDDEFPIPDHRAIDFTPAVLDRPGPSSKGPQSLLPDILEMFPNISHQYVDGLISRHRGNSSTVDDANIDTSVMKERIVDEILENPSYPRQEKLKRKTGDTSISDDRWESPTQHPTADYRKKAINILAAEFPLVSIHLIQQIIADKKGLYPAYLSLQTQINGPFKSEPLPSTLKRPRGKVPKDQVWDNDLMAELNAAKRRAENDIGVRRQQDQREEAERLNEEEHARSGNLVECQCCYLEVPPNRTVPCEGANVHFFCFTCIRKSAETQIGMMKYKLQCFDTSGCQAGFAKLQMSEALGSSLLGKLEHLQQQDEIEQAGLDGLENCPFCEFKAICPPVEEDREFRCFNPTCEVVSCRLCKDNSHIPKTCAEAKKEKGLPARHAVEEAMSDALIRKCPRCKVKIVKEQGCNKMICTKCLCVMCYLCQKDITRELYDHFGKAPTYCDTHDTAKARLEAEVQRAQSTAIKKALKDNPDLTEEELRVDTKNVTKAPHTMSGAPPSPVLPAWRHQPRRQQARHVREVALMPANTAPNHMFIPQQQPNNRRYKPPHLLHRTAQVPVLNPTNTMLRPLHTPHHCVFDDLSTRSDFGPHYNPIDPTIDHRVPSREAPPFPPIQPLPPMLPNTNSGNVSNRRGLTTQLQLPALNDYRGGSLPGQSQYSPIWLDGPGHNI
ncbi:hypothetical protein BDV25DRAFT_142573 [Aspergillus avenaceus]|uniref:RING-type domain-containing protein n=1 Tax=Aspergillus avenaceus TaxID=36643 RepID=A0A5N6TMN6_ASPAV|nr:hypothetical protein BDV25DRAFT_142573 [Aspergillus avenaceus]